MQIPMHSTSIQQFTSIIQRDGDWYVAFCPELDIASQGRTIEEARTNLIEAIELFLETASPTEIQERLHSDVFISPNFLLHFLINVLKRLPYISLQCR